MAKRGFIRSSVQLADHGARRSAMRIVCSVCGTDDHVATSKTSNLPDDVIARKFRQAGWEVGSSSKTDLCPACAARKSARPEKIVKEIVVAETPKTSTAAEKAAPTPSASKRITDLYMLLEDHYDRAARNYRAGWSDKRIATQLEISEVLVAQRREQDFGPIVIDTTLDDLSALMRELKDAQQRLLEVGMKNAEFLQKAIQITTKIEEKHAVIAKRAGA